MKRYVKASDELNEELIIHCDKKTIKYLYDRSALTFEGCALTRDNLDFLVKWLKEHNCDFKGDQKFYVISGKLMNDTYQLTGDNRYPDDLTILCIDLNDLTNVGAIVLPRFELGGRWLDDVIDNNLRREGREDEDIDIDFDNFEEGDIDGFEEADEEDL